MYNVNGGYIEMLTKEIRLFRKKLKNGPVWGPFSKTEDPALIEAIGYAGFDFVIIDLEHGPNSIRSTQNLIRAAQISGLFPIVRVKESLTNYIGEVLDIGAGGIEVPQITCAEDANRAIEAAKFFPDGMRGVCRYVRAADYSSMDRFQYFSEANETIIILQLEGEKAINNLESILNVPGIDIIFIGPYDLSQALGVPGRTDHPKVIEKMRFIIDFSMSKGIYVGTFVENKTDSDKWREIGVRYLCYSVDIGIFFESCKKAVELCKQ